MAALFHFLVAHKIKIKECHIIDEVVQVVKNPLANAGDTGRRGRFCSLSQEDPWKKEMATHTSILAREIPWTEEPGSL